jgi:hypothetical protein
MSHCPNCSRPVAPGRTACPSCGADLPKEPGTAVASTEALAKTPPREPEQITATRAPGKLFWASIAFALAVTIAQRALTQPQLIAWIGAPVLRSVPRYGAHLLLALVQYVLPAFAIYVLLRIGQVERWLRPRAAIHVLLASGNALLIVYLGLSIFAASVPGGGGSYVVATFAPFFVFSAYGLYAIAFAWLVVRSIRLRMHPRTRLRWSTPEAAVLVLLLVGLTAPAAPLFVGATAPFQVGRAAERLFRLRCMDAADRIFDTPAQPVRGLYLAQDANYSYGELRDGVYRWRESSIMGEPLVNSGLLLFFEKPVYDKRSDAKYTRHVMSDRVGIAVDALESEYGVFRRELAATEDKSLGLYGVEVSIRDLKTSQPIATSTYFVNKTLGRFCGNAQGSHYSESDFVVRALALTRQYPSAWSDSARK